MGSGRPSGTRPADWCEMALLEEMIANGRIVDVMLAFIALEIAFVVGYRRMTGGGIALIPLLTNIGAGGSLILALRMSISDAGWPWVAGCLLCALFFHLADLAQRWSAPQR